MLKCVATLPMNAPRARADEIFLSNEQLTTYSEILVMPNKLTAHSSDHTLARAISIKAEREKDSKRSKDTHMVLPTRGSCALLKFNPLTCLFFFYVDDAYYCFCIIIVGSPLYASPPHQHRIVL